MLNINANLKLNNKQRKIVFSNPEHFDKNEINNMLKTKDFGCFELF